MEYTEIDNTQIIKAFFKYKTVHKHTLLLCVSLSWCWLAITFGIDDDLICVLPFIVLPFIIGLLVSRFATLKLQLDIFSNRITGTHFFNKSFYLPIETIQSVKPYGISGIKILCQSGKTYNFSYITNRDDVCTTMANIGIYVDITLIKDTNSIITSETDIKKHNLFKKLLTILPWLGNIFLTNSALWYNSYDNRYYHTYTAYYYYGGYKIPYESGYWAHYYELGEMLTTYLAIACFICVFVLSILYLIMANNRISVSASMVRGINGLGKATVIPIGQITNATIRSQNSMISINQMGKVYKYFWLLNNTQICALISDIKSGNQPNIAEKNANTNVDATSNKAINTTSQCMTYTAEDIKQLKALLDEGIISEQEFETKKKQILNL